LTGENYMKLALRLAIKGLGKTSPNPMVGAVIVKDDRIIGEGYHRYFGGKHAEINAIDNASEDVRGATLYVTLEPCSHFGKTPPCVDAVIKSGISKVVIGVLDPNPKVNGKGFETLKQHGIETEVGVLGKECRELNESFFKYMTTGIPLVTVKFAQTLDGRIAAATGDSRWLSSAASRRLAHKLRATSDAVMVGVGTVIADNPQLTTRLFKGRNPTRIVLDSGLRIPLESKILTEQELAPTLIVSTPDADKGKLSALKQMDIEVLSITQNEQGKVDLPRLIEALGKRGISSVLVEGGSETITSMLRLKLADRIVSFVTPRIMGKGIETVGDLNIKGVEDTLKLSFSRVYKSGEDVVIEARVLNSRNT
jgi:diaminohydroxyphosphoribosylaminopyrimidine deaminase / 5-amino-6-(5-phosphoribosylamino)uracil reductase